MSRADKKGRPPRYDGEEQERLSIMIRPRYKKALEMLKQHRQCNLTEATELAIIKLASGYEADGRPLIDYVRPPNELRLMIENSFASGEDDATERLPSPFQTPFEKYMDAVIDEEDRAMFNGRLINQAVKEMWRQGLTELEASVIVKEAINRNN